MAHDIRTSPTPHGHQTILTVAQTTEYASGKVEITGDVEVRFQPTLNRVVTCGHGVIAREDLYAFRELLNELPEEAFVEPKPVDEPLPFWSTGDLVVHQSRGGPMAYELLEDGIWAWGPDRLTYYNDFGVSPANVHLGRILENHVREGNPEYFVAKRANA